MKTPQVNSNRVMPNRLDFGRHFVASIGEAMMHDREYKILSDEERIKTNPFNYRVVMGYFLPSWQRGLVWNEAQKIALLESLWLGVNIGTYTFNRGDIDSRYDNLLIDGQQRLHAIECYLNNEFKVFGYRWSEVTQVDRRLFQMGCQFPVYITETENEIYLKEYYNLMNFGGVSHSTESKLNT